MNRRELREQIFMLLFRVEFNQKDDMPEQCTLFLEDGDTEISEKDAAYIRSKYEKIAEKLPEIDKLINETAIGWDTQRMGKVELTIIRLAVYEIRFDETVPTGVAINEAVELAKKFGQEGSSGFVTVFWRNSHEKCLYSSPGKRIYQKYVYPGFFTPVHSGQRRSEQL